MTHNGKEWLPFEAALSPVHYDGVQHEMRNQEQEDNECLSLSPEESRGKCGTTNRAAQMQQAHHHPQPLHMMSNSIKEFSPEEKHPSTDCQRSPFKFSEAGDTDIRHQLLIQRTFNNHEEPGLSSPMRKVRMCTKASSALTTSISPSKRTVPFHEAVGGGDSVQISQLPSLMCTSSPFSSHNQEELIAASPQDMQVLFKTPVRGKRYGQEATESAVNQVQTPVLPSPSGLTPGRQFVNPFEVNHDRLHLPVFSPSMFHVATSGKKGRKDEGERFWSVEHSALLMPVEIKESEVHRQHRYLTKIEREKDAQVQKAINTFFSNELIVPSPWSEKVKHVLPRTPGAIKSVSCQTALSVPPGVDLFAQLDGKYHISDDLMDAGASPDGAGTSFIRRKLLHQLNENDSSVNASPLIGVHREAARETQLSNSPSPGKQTTPEWEKQTPNKGHFSSSPIRPELGSSERHHHPLSETDLLASPELSPIARRGKTVRHSGIYSPHLDMDSPRAIMQLDFSSILDDPDENDEGTVSDKTGTLIHKSVQPRGSYNSEMSGIAENPFAVSNSLHDSEEVSTRSGCTNARHLLTSAASTESTTEVATAVTSSSQDTGYQTASLQSTNQDSGSHSNLANQEGGLGLVNNQNISSGVKWVDQECGSSSITFGNDGSERETESLHTSLTNQFLDLPYKSEMSLDIDGSFLSFAATVTRETVTVPSGDSSCNKKEDTCRVRKVRMLPDSRRKEKSSVSRDLTLSFNEEAELSQLSNPDKDSGIKIRSLEDENLISVTGVPRTEDHTTGNRSEIHYKCEKGQTQLSASDISMRSISPCLNSSHSEDKTSGNKGGGFLTSMPCAGHPVHYTDPCPHADAPNSSELDVPAAHYSLADNTLTEARKLLGKSEELRMRFSVSEALEADSLFQIISSDNKENCDSLMLEKASIAESGHNNQASPKTFPQVIQSSPRPQEQPFLLPLSPVRASTPTSAMLDSVKRQIENVEGGKLGSEIAAEILKRAGEDLAQLTSTVGVGQNTPHNEPCTGP